MDENKISDLKILVCGDVCGNFRSLFSRVDMIVKKKGAFEHLLCVGNFFGSNPDEWDDLRSGKIKVPVATYILGANEVSHETFYKSVDLVPNLIYLGKKGSLTGSSGLKIAYLSGVELPDGRQFSKNKSSRNSQNDTIYFTRKDVDELINSLESGTVIDILLTSQWPKGITKYAVSIDQDSSTIDSCSSSLISKLAKAIKPRYHFCGLAGLYYERVPYRNHAILQESAVHTTQFFALASVNNILKQKWLYAFAVTPGKHIPYKVLAETHGPATVCPYEFEDSSNKSEGQFFYDTESSSTHLKKRSRGGDDHQSKKRQSIDSSSCWFCLSNADVEKQLIISIGSHCYVTLAKGILVPEHTLIVPINHAISSVELSDNVSEEVEKFKQSLANYFHDKGKDVVFFERNYSSPHLQIQAVPVPKQLKHEIKDALFSAAKHFDLDFNELPTSSKVQQIAPPKKPYFYIEIMINKKTDAKYLHIINQKFPLQFGRVVLASSEVLNVEDRIDWRQCQDSKSVEKEMTEKMRKGFASYDFT